ncbi:acyl-ACP--UDP-N-acetylglucosamine O-acyltransferase [Rickettsiales endosymbiont of Stachyamoeba lipophora]|uniref:acyl-ACP--UDP-N-acetylglucosamine O-acyltransferase n=1 Tax=Rickettsiales endosymbiont of Stachyamoeba lipophora TaxID=2486578 RepID=UPI000F651E3F|nr:acyl-ACP--UDP-N-acetylglucosamine O-acyltransferase [Rickettsiales endosymbiont of Stachyamoeba lipophora]AZL15780.1 acyl-ACP--UDP-N-acetylglucosamine O-acyltransferase [Rickettsiales endosymbiont of Stachyamoeba lipophora]
MAQAIHLIHQTAIISPSAKIGNNVKIGAYSIIGDNVELGDDNIIHSHVVIDGLTTIGNNNQIFPFAAIGLAPQDLKFKGEQSKLIIGNNNVIREYVTINPGTEGGGMLTAVGNNCLFMVSSHIAHDCKVGNNVILANNATLAGHVKVEDFAIIGGLSAVHQFVRIGSHAMIGGMSGIEKDIIPFGTAMGERASLAGLNIIGMKRRNFDRDEINALRNMYKMLFEEEEGLTFDQKVTKVRTEMGSSEAVKQILEFIDADASRAVCRPK